MIKIYVLIIILFLHFAFSKVRANGPLRDRNLNTESQSARPAQAGIRTNILSGPVSKANRLSGVNPENNSTATHGQAEATLMTKGIRTNTGILNARTNSSVKAERSIALNLAGRHSTNDGVAIGIANFINSLSRITARYSISRSCSFYTKFIVTNRTANFGLNF